MPITNNNNQEELYSPWVGLVFVFNLIVGTGALTLPAVFANAGWLLSSILITLLALFGFVTVTFIVESMACANATIHRNLIVSHKFDSENEDDLLDDEQYLTEHTAILPNRPDNNNRPHYTLNERVELAHMAKLYFTKTGHVLFVLSLCVYLYGDLSIYAAAIAKTLSDITCNSTAQSQLVLNGGGAEEDFATQACVQDGSWSSMAVYRVYVLIFIVCVGPFAYVNVQKTKYLQVLTTSMRWTAFTIMIAIAAIRLVEMGAQAHPPAMHLDGVPALLGASVYSFMCHHSLPALIAPFADKQHITRLLALDYTLITLFYLLLALTGSFAFANVADLYTLNFGPSALHVTGILVKGIELFLVLFPVFALSTSFPIIAVTLQNNLKAVFLDVRALDRYGYWIRNILFPTLAVAPPTIVALSTHNLRFLVELTGCFAGVVVQYIVPALLVGVARNACARDLGPDLINRYASPFKGKRWIGIVLCWSLACITLVIVNFFQY